MKTTAKGCKYAIRAICFNMSGNKTHIEKQIASGWRSHIRNCVENMGWFSIAYPSWGTLFHQLTQNSTNCALEPYSILQPFFLLTLHNGNCIISICPVTLLALYRVLTFETYRRRMNISPFMSHVLELYGKKVSLN